MANKDEPVYNSVIGRGDINPPRKATPADEAAVKETEKAEEAAEDERPDLTVAGVTKDDPFAVPDK